MPSKTVQSSPPPAFREVWVWVLALIGVGTSATAAWVHHRLLTDPTYTSFCDVGTTLSCSGAYLSSYGNVWGIPVAVFGAIWFAGVLALLVVRRSSAQTVADNVPAYVFLWSTIGLAVVLYFAYASFFVLREVCLLCTTMYAAVIGIFFLSGAGPQVPMTSLPRRFFSDLRTLFSSPVALATSAAWVVMALGAIAFFPRATPVAAASAAESTAGAGAAIEQVTAEQRAEVEKWFDAQPRAIVPVEAAGATVVVVKFNDYQCPPCRMTFENYKPIWAKYAQQAPGKVRFVTKDFPLEQECNGTMQSAGPHQAACEAAVAVRLAREKNKAEALEDYLFANQPQMTPALIREGLAQIAGVTDFDARYAKTLELVKADTALGGVLGVKSTPTFFVNGVRIEGGLQAPFLDVVIDYALRKAAK